MVISISGPCSTGKTTLVNEIKNKNSFCGFENIVVINETIRDLWARDFANRVSDTETMLSNKDLTMEWTEAVSKEISTHVKNKLSEIDLEKTLVVLDRCCLDHFVYTITNTMKFGISNKTLAIVLENFANIDEKIDIMFRTEVPENDYFEDDGIRPHNLFENRMLENNFFKLLFRKQALLLPYNISDRVDFIEKQIYQLMKDKNIND